MNENCINTLLDKLYERCLYVMKNQATPTIWKDKGEKKMEIRFYKTIKKQEYHVIMYTKGDPNGDRAHIVTSQEGLGNLYNELSDVLGEIRKHLTQEQWTKTVSERTAEKIEGDS